MEQIDRRSIIPLYYQLAQILRSQIKTGTAKPGEKLPSERELMHTYHLSRNTVRQAINVLADEGLVFQNHGRGNYIVGAGFNIRYKINTFVEHNELLRRVGKKPGVSHLKTEEIAADEVITKALGLEPGERVICFTKLFTSDDQPVILTYDYLPKNLLKEGYDPCGSGEAFLDFLQQQTGVEVEFTLSDIVPIVPPKEVAGLLHLSQGAAILLLQETFLDPSKNLSLAFANNYYHPDIHFRVLRRCESSAIPAL